MFCISGKKEMKTGQKARPAKKRSGHNAEKRGRSRFKVGSTVSLKHFSEIFFGGIAETSSASPRKYYRIQYRCD